jgi:hypothetical protein
MGVAKAASNDLLGRFREVVSDPLNLLVERVPMAGVVENGHVYLHNGNRVPLSGKGAYYDAFSQILVLNRGVHEPLEEYVFQQLLKRLPEAPVMTELGAYWGHYSMWLKKARRRARVILVEPNKENLEAGMANFKANGFGGEFLQAFVGKGYFEVDHFMERAPLERLDILHADIQGYETDMIDGAREALGKRRIDYVFVSTHSQEKHERVCAELAGAGYEVEISSDFDNETTSFDGFIFASSPNVEPLFDRKPHIPGRAEIVASRPERLLEAVAAIRSCSRAVESLESGR